VTAAGEAPAGFLRRHRGAVSIVLMIGSLAAAVGAALLTGARIGPITGTVEGLASWSSTIIANL